MPLAEDVSLLAALLAGVVYFASPCCWPLYPAYLAVLAGGPGAELPRARLLGRALAFLAGFTAVFVALGAVASAIGQLLLSYQAVLQRVAGVVVAALGLQMAGWVQWPLPVPGRRAAVQASGPLGAALAGAAFAFGWTPCVVPVLGSILLLASSAATLADGIRLLLVFSAGFALPFLALALLLPRLAGRLPGGRVVAALHRAAGYGLIALGVLVYFGMLNRISAWLFYAFD